MILSLLDEAVAQGARREVACATLGLTARTVQRWRQQGSHGGQDRRAGPLRSPSHALTERERAEALATLRSPRFRDASPKTVVPALADEGRYLASESTLYRLLRKVGETTPRGRAKPATPRPVATHTATGPNQLWSWDITYLPTTVRGLFFYLYVIVDVFSRRIMGWAVHEQESSDLAASLILAACKEARVARRQLTLHSDNGSPMRGMTMLAMLRQLGVEASFSRPSVSDDNAFSEALFRTVKYVPWWPRAPFATPEEARAWVQRFVAWYNTEHLHSGLGFVTPEARHRGEDAGQLAQRRRVYEDARQSHPARWSGPTRLWARPEAVSLNARKSRRSTAPATVACHAPARRGSPPTAPTARTPEVSTSSSRPTKEETRSHSR